MTALVPVILLPLIASASQVETSKKDVVLKTRMVRGTFVGFEVGDYVHAIVKGKDGNERSFFIGSPGLDYYLATKLDQEGSFTYQVVDSYIPEAGGRMRTERMIEAKVGKTGSKRWWKAKKAANTLEALDKEFGPLVQKATRGG